LQLKNGRNLDVALGLHRVPPDLPEVVVTEVQVESHGGVRVPMTILHRKGVALDGRNPVLLSGCASYGFSISAFFSTETIARRCRRVGARGGLRRHPAPCAQHRAADRWRQRGADDGTVVLHGLSRSEQRHRPANIK